MPHHRRTCSGLVSASKTRCRGASKRRVSSISVSDGVETLKVRLFAALLTGMGFLLGVLGFHLLEVAVEAVEPCLPNMAVAFSPVRHFLERRRLDAAGSPLRLAAARDEPGAFQHAEVLGYGGHA